MSVTVVENIAIELYDRLYAMIGDVTYETAVADVIRPVPSVAHTPEHLQIVIRQGASERVPELDHPGNPPATCRRQVFNLHLHAHDTESADTFDETINTFVADVIKAVSTPQATWHTFDSNAIDAEFLDTEPVVTDGGTGGVNLPLAVTYRTDENNPYNARA